VTIAEIIPADGRLPRRRQRLSSVRSSSPDADFASAAPVRPALGVPHPTRSA
jgi:hypothetical protein